MSIRKNGAYVPIPKQNDRNQLFFEFYKKEDLSMEKKENVAKKGRKKV